MVTGPGEPALLAGVDLRVRYAGGTDVLAGAALRVTAGRRLAVLGANGSGKTTLLRVLSGALAARSGQVRWQGTPMARDRAGLSAHRQRVQLVLQDPADQLFSADVYQDVSYGPVNLGLSTEEVRDRVARSLGMLSLQDLAQRPVHHLSFGQQKRVALAGAVAMQPEVLLLDEPTAGLDPQGAEELLRCLDVLEGLGTTVVLSTHDVPLAWSWADDVALVVDGTAHQGPARELLADDALLTRARLRLPWQVRLLRELGCPPDPDEAPREVSDVAAVIARRLGRGARPG